ncbi:DUF3618 domain-containing protein [Tranquillimonas alkanivorans]|uniref:DUF3618 domain-containing protein n=1 Tax=Tranquillimonas alkanivorans TaxID=441119 RepID=A0A1I5PIW0_9RHOB|nr:DUF3618 domain-containing protein [Tranquillimonas alkanivorans]SFP33975.1 Protein of unknown function [Tranquillimonas alkanivorans]
MPVDHVRTPEEIEREIEEERSGLSRTMHDLQEKMSFDGVMGDAMESLSASSSDIAYTVSRTVRRNPTGFAIAGLGLAWLAYSMSRNSERDDLYNYERGHSSMYPTYGGGDTRYTGMDPVDRVPPRGPVPAGTPYPGAGTEGGHDSPWDEVAERVREHRRAAEIGGANAKARARGYASQAGARFEGAKHDAEGRLEGAKARARGYAHEAEGRWEGAKARGRGYGARLRSSAHSLRERIADGTHEMNEEARRRVIAARNRAYEAQVRAEYMARRGSSQAGDFFEEQPLVAGALAMAVGAAIGGMLPSTRREDEAFGAYRDDLFAEAQRVYEEESAKLADVARATADEAKKQAQEVADTAKKDVKEGASDVSSKARDAVDKVGDKAEEEAKDKNVGGSVKS